MSIYFLIFIFVLFICFCVLFLFKYFYNKKCVTFLYSSITIIFLFFVSDMASSSGKRKSTRPRPLTDADLQNVLDMLDNDDDDDGALADTNIEDGDSDDDDDEDTETNFVNIVDNEVGTNINSSDTYKDETTNDGEFIRNADHNKPIRCAKLPNLEETMNEDNYDRLTTQ